ncbi:unnamed protein product [Chrysoparadoxa australica]
MKGVLWVLCLGHLAHSTLAFYSSPSSLPSGSTRDCGKISRSPLPHPITERTQVKCPSHSVNGAGASASPTVHVYDTTLRDGTQMEGISVTVNDKLKIARQLCAFGMHYIECGWPGSNPKDQEFFSRAQKELPTEAWARVVAFGSTRRKFTACADDTQLEALIAAGTNCVTIVAKAWDLHVDHILEVPREENVAMVRESVEYLKAAGKEVMIDLEHFFDGYKASPTYAMEVCKAAALAGADVLVLCDTNGGTLPWEIGATTRTVKEAFPSVRVGIHCHNDQQEMAVANSLQAVQDGATVVQGTVNGIGERTGNANLVSIVPVLQLKMGSEGVGEGLKELTALSRFTDEQLNRVPESKAPFVGQSAFAHKGGIHVSAVNKIPDSYQHIDPAEVGNLRRVLVSELSGRSNIISKVQQFGMGSEEEMKTSTLWKERVGTVLSTVKGLERKGYTFEGADASVNLMIRRLMRGYTPPFRLLEFNVQTHGSDLVNGIQHFHQADEEDQGGRAAAAAARATVKVKLPGDIAKQETPHPWDDDDPRIRLESAEGVGPVNALAKALYKALLPYYPSLQYVTLTDYKVRILDQDSATAAKTRVMIEFWDSLHNQNWSTVGVNSNIISASMHALVDGFQYGLVEYGHSCKLEVPKVEMQTQSLHGML